MTHRDPPRTDRVKAEAASARAQYCVTFHKIICRKCCGSGDVPEGVDALDICMVGCSGCQGRGFLWAAAWKGKPTSREDYDIIADALDLDCREGE